MSEASPQNLIPQCVAEQVYADLVLLSELWSINDRDRVNFDRAAGGQRHYAEHHVRWLVTGLNEEGVVKRKRPYDNHVVFSS